MSYIDRNLLESETIVFRTRLHWLLFARPLVVILVIALPLLWLLHHAGHDNWLWLPAAATLVLIVGAWIGRSSSDFAVTNRRVMMKMGVLRTRSIELMLGKVEAIAVNQTLMGRLFGYGDLVVTGSGGTRESFANIQAPLEFRRAVQSVVDLRQAA